MSTGINNFPANEEHNPGGNESFFFRPVDDVVEIPEAIAKLISNNVTFASGVTGFFSGYSTPESLQFSEKQTNDPDLGPAFEVLVQGFYPCAHPDYDELFDTIAQYRHIVLVKDNNERQRLAGNIEKGLRFTASFNTGGKFGNLKGYEFAFTGIYKERQPYYGSVPALEPPDCPGVTVNINGSEFAEYAAGSNPNIEVVDGSNNPLGSELAGKWVIASTELDVDFSVDDATPITNQVINFTDLTVGATQWLWDFGDGTTSSLQNPNKTYAYAGTYSVTLCATNGSVSGKEVKSNYVVVTLQGIPTTNLVAHYKAPVGASPSNMTLVSGAVSQWNDDTGTYNMTQGSVTSRPAYLQTLLTAPDGTVYGGAIFDAINDFLENTSIPRTATTTVIVIGKQPFIKTTSCNFFTSGTADLGIVSQLANNPQFRVNNGAGLLDTRVAFPFNNFFAAIFQFDNAGNARIIINDLPAYSLPNFGANTGTGFVLGGNNAGSAQAFIDCLEVIIYSTALSAGDVTNLNNYRRSKFGIL